MHSLGDPSWAPAPVQPGGCPGIIQPVSGDEPRGGGRLFRQASLLPPPHRGEQGPRGGLPRPLSSPGAQHGTARSLAREMHSSASAQKNEHWQGLWLPEAGGSIA